MHRGLHNRSCTTSLHDLKTLRASKGTTSELVCAHAFLRGTTFLSCAHFILIDLFFTILKAFNSSFNKSPIKTYIKPVKTYIKPIKTYIKPIQNYTKPIKTYIKRIKAYIKHINTYIKPINTYIKHIKTTELYNLYAQTLILVNLIVVNLFSFFNFTRNGSLRF